MAPNPSEFCRDPHRRGEIRERGLNGVDYIEVSDDRLTLAVYFLRVAPEQITKNNVLITGGVRVRNIEVADIRLRASEDPGHDDCMDVFVDKPGDFSTYTLRLVDLDEYGEPTARPLAGFDLRYAQANFNFNVGPSTDLDCKQAPVCAPPDLPTPEINYLAKDYSTFRQLILDRLATTMPTWRERHVPDLGIALVEILAYVGDYLSYYQDAVATEAYLATARQRISVRRHVRLIDYAMHEGCNARTWIHINVAGDVVLEPRKICFLTGSDGGPSSGAAGRVADAAAGASDRQTAVFEPVASAKIRLHEFHNEISFYTWGDRLCCLPIGATSATLLDGWEEVAVDTKEPPDQTYEPRKRGAKSSSVRLAAAEYSAAPQKESETPPGKRGQTLPPKYAPATPGKYSDAPTEPSPPAVRGRKLRLQPGDVLLFEEGKGRDTGIPEDANPSHRHFVRLTRVEQAVDPLHDLPVVEVGWGPEDALPFALILSMIGPASPRVENGESQDTDHRLAKVPPCEYVSDVSLARGNVVLADHGDWTGNASRIEDEDLGVVPCVSTLERCEGLNRPAQIQVEAETFRPVLKRAPLTFRQPASETAAANALQQDPRSAVPEIELRSIPPMFDGSGPLFNFADLQDPSALAARLMSAAARAATSDGSRPSAADQAARFLRNHLSAETLAPLGEVDKSGALPEGLASALRSDLAPLVRHWVPKHDLLASHSQDFHFVVEMDDGGHAHLRFGDGERGRAPEAGEQFVATYRVGNGAAGNVGRETVHRIVLARDAGAGVVMTPRNPIAATGGSDPEPVAKVKLIAPGAFQRELQRAITAEDYARLAEQNTKVQRAAATLQWTGTRYKAHVAIDPLGTGDVDPRLLQQIRGSLHRYRRIGHDIVVAPAHYVPLDVEITANIAPRYIGGHVKQALLDAFSNRALPDGRRGFFHPDNLTFGQAIYLSRIVAVAQGVVGVESVLVTRLERAFAGPNQEIETGVLPIGPLEVARLDNDANRPENGKLQINVRGGR